MLELDPAAIAAHVNDQDLPVVLLQGESLEILKCFGDNSIDSLVLDPPGGVCKEGNLSGTFNPAHIEREDARYREISERTGRRASRNGIALYSADYDLSLRGKRLFRDHMQAILEEGCRVLKPGGHGAIWGYHRTVPYLGVACDEAGLEVKTFHVHIFGTGRPNGGVKILAEPWYLVQKPISESTIERNVARWGVGRLNIDACRIGGQGQGRHVANVTFEHQPECQPAGLRRFGRETVQTYNCVPGCPVGVLEEQYPGASRFYYCAKPSQAERDAGLEHLEPINESGRRNPHPTPKPVQLMRYWERLITPQGGTVLDCFMGSGTTGVAAVQEGFRFRGIDREYMEIAHERIEHALKNRDSQNQ